jgi:hypothetical protein
MPTETNVAVDRVDGDNPARRIDRATTRRAMLVPGLGFAWLIGIGLWANVWALGAPSSYLQTFSPTTVWLILLLVSSALFVAHRRGASAKLVTTIGLVAMVLGVLPPWSWGLLYLPGQFMALWPAVQEHLAAMRAGETAAERRASP